DRRGSRPHRGRARWRESDRSGHGHARCRATRPEPRRARRRRAPGACLFQLRHVQGLRRARGRVPSPGARGGGMTAASATVQRDPGWGGAPPNHEPDRVLAACVVALVGFGIMMVYSASAVFAAKEFGSSTYFLTRQAAFAVGGIVAMFVGSQIDYHFYRKLTYPMLAAAAAGLLLCATGLGTTVGGASRWLRLGPVGIQPSEIAKVAIIMYLSYSLAKKA